MKLKAFLIVIGISGLMQPLFSHAGAVLDDRSQVMLARSSVLDALSGGCIKGIIIPSLESFRAKHGQTLSEKDKNLLLSKSSGELRNVMAQGNGGNGGKMFDSISQLCTCVMKGYLDPLPDSDFLDPVKLNQVMLDYQKLLASKDPQLVSTMNSCGNTFKSKMGEGKNVGVNGSTQKN